MTQEPCPSPFRDTTEEYRSIYDIHLQKDVGTSFTGGFAEAFGDWDTQVRGVDFIMWSLTN